MSGLLRPQELSRMGSHAHLPSRQGVIRSILAVQPFPKLGRRPFASLPRCLSFLGRLDEPPPAKIVGQNSPDCRDELLCCLLSGTRTCLLVTLSLASWLTCDPGMAPVGPCDAGGLKVEYLNNRFECLYLVQQLRRQVAGVTIFTPAPAVLLRYLLAK